jgi:hypothetical protein
MLPGMTKRLTVTVPDELDEAVRAAAGENVSAYTARALRNQLLIDDLDRLAGVPLDEDMAADGADAFEIAEQREAARRGRAA